MASEGRLNSLPDISNLHLYSYESSLASFIARSCEYGSSSFKKQSPSNLVELSTTDWQTPSDIGEFITVLDKLGVEGPLTLMFNTEECDKIGQGGQFTVYRNRVRGDADQTGFVVYHYVAVKKCVKFEFSSGSKALELRSPEYRTQMHDMLLEVAALRAPGIYRQRNIVELIGYGVETWTWHETPFLVMELAADNLGIFLAQEERSWEILQQLCLDVGCGLDVIHYQGLVHGDLKPPNVLVFPVSSQEQVLWVAKLADFGFSCRELDHREGGSVRLRGCSHGWTAPEVQKHVNDQTPITVEQLLAADIYVYGLLIFSCFCFQGKAVPFDAYDLPEKVDKLTLKVPDPLRTNLRRAIRSLLQSDHTSRPQTIDYILTDLSQTCIKWYCAVADYEDERSLAILSPYSWELPSLGPFFVGSIDDAFYNHKEDLTGAQLFAMYLYKSFIDAHNVDKSTQVDMLLEAGRKGYPPAMGVAGAVLRSYGLPVSEYLTLEDRENWLFSAVSTGSIFAYQELSILNSNRAQAAMKHFRNMSGQCMHYSPILEDDSDNNTSVRKDCVSGFGTNSIAEPDELERDILKAFLDRVPSEVNLQNQWNETSLYRACMVGSAEMVLELCNRGGDASITQGDFDISCLHWLFNFSASKIHQVLRALLKAGAKVNQKLSTICPLATPHYPFTLPPGTPLHWAVTMASQQAITALLEAGADPTIRNGNDPYKSDDNVRPNVSQGNLEVGQYSETPEIVLGMTPVDLATAAHDWRSLHALSLPDDGQRPALLSADEEGYTPFHRLSLQQIGRTGSATRFWYPAFKGSPTTRRENLRKTIQWLKALGGDIDRLTNTPEHVCVMGREGLSPLMIAVTKHDVDAVEALCKAGANVNLQNRCGETALTLVSGPFSYKTETLRAMISCLIKHDANPNFRSPTGRTPLACVATVGDIRAFRLLLEAGADITTQYNNVAAVAYLARMNVAYSNVQPHVNEREVVERDQEMSKLLSDYISSKKLGVDFKADDTGATLLHYCAAAAVPECTKMLLDLGASTDVRCMELKAAQRSVGFFTRNSSVTGTPEEVIQRQLDHFLNRRWGAQLSVRDSEFVYARMKQIQKALESS